MDRAAAIAPSLTVPSPDGLTAVRGSVFNVQRYSIHDGPGIRTTVFLKKCSLTCLWCQNPESQQEAPELFFDADKCAGCGRCQSVCPEGAITMRDGRSWTDRSRCTGAGHCAEVCPQGARSLMGRYLSAGEVFREIAEDSIFYEQSGGGVTLSGGDPLAQPEFALALLRLCKQAGLHTTLDTCGYAAWPTVRQLLEHVDLVLFDLKHMDSNRHRQLTGVGNEPILRNVRKIHHELRRPLRIRFAVIPGHNDEIANVEATADFVAGELGRSVPVDLLPFHRFGEAKYQRLQRPDPLAGFVPPDPAQLAGIQAVFQSRGLSAHLGG